MSRKIIESEVFYVDDTEFLISQGWEPYGLRFRTDSGVLQDFVKYEEENL